MFSQFDASRGDQTKEIDLGIVTNQCLIAIEAKSWGGTIDPLGDPLNTPWFSAQRSSRFHIHSSGINPLKQVKGYSDALQSILKEAPFPHLFCYGLITFRDSADISRLGIEVGPSIVRLNDFFYVATADTMVAALGFIHEDARKRQRVASKRPAPTNIHDYLFGLRSQRQKALG